MILVVVILFVFLGDITCAAIVARSISRSAKMSATASGCTTYGSPEARNCPSWAVSAKV